MMSRIFSISFSFLLLLSVLSCSSDGSDNLRFSAIGTIESRNGIYLDFDKKTIYSDESIPADFTIGDRVVVDFEFLDTITDYNVYIIQLEKIPTQDSVIHITVADYSSDTLFNDVIRSIRRMWLSLDYLTVDFLYTGVDYDLHEFQWVLIDSLNPPKYGNEYLKHDTISLNFRHFDGNDEKSSESRQSLYSFNLSEFKPLGYDSVLLVVKTELYRTDSTSVTDTRYFYYK